MAPEQRDSPADVDHRADIYSLGVVFYELLTGELPTGSFAPPSAKSAADPRVDAIVQQALEKERTRRQSSAGEMKTQVQTLSGPSAAPPPAEHKLLHLEGVTTFRSLTAMRFAQTACIGFVGFLGYIPGWRALFGFYGFFGLIGVAYLIEAVARRKGPAGAPSTRPGKTGWLPITLPALVFVIVFLGILGAVVRVQNTQVPIPASLTLPAAASFGPVIQRLIATGTAPDSFYSVDSADYVPPPADISPLLWKSYAEWTWLTLSDVDFLAVAETGSPRLVLSDMVISSCDEADFDRWSPRDLADDIGVRTAFASLVRPNFNEPLTGNHGGRITLAFQTRYQRIGMVQVLGISRDPPGVMIRYKLIQDAAVSQSKRQRFEPTDGMADKTSWEVDDKPSEWNPNGWAIIAHMTLGGVAQARLPGQTEDFCRIKLTAGNDQAVTLDIDDLKANNSMTITLERDHWTDLVVNGINYRIGYPAVYVAAGQPDSTAYALIVVTHSAPATPPVAQSAPADSDPEVLKIQLRSAEHDLLQKQQAFNAGMISEADFDAAHDKVALLIARLSGDPVQIANATLQAAQRQFDLIFKLHESRLLTDSDFYKARDEVAIARVKLREAEANAASSKAASSPPAGPVSGPSPTPAAAIVPGIELQTAEQQLTQTLTDIQETQISLAEASLRYTSLHPRIIDIKSKLNTLQQQADRLRASIRQAVGYNPPQAASGPSPEVADPIPAIELRIEEQQLAQALLDIQDAQNTLALLKTRYGDSHPQVILARTRLDALQSQAARLRALIRQHSAPQ
jgi:serine/threonine protein kinase